MALAKNTEYKSVTIESAYFRVSSVTAQKDTMTFGLGLHATETSEMISHETYSCAYDIDGENPIKQAYEHLKTLPEFSDAEDV